MGVCMSQLPTLHEQFEGINASSHDVPVDISHIKNLFVSHEIVGRGCTSSVRKVTKKSTGKFLAMKKMVRTGNFSQLFKNEIKFISSLIHDNIIKMEGAYYDDNNFYIATDYCSGGRLLDKVKKVGQFSEQKASTLIKSILNAIKFCHDQNIVHRDLKLDNIMFDKEGDDSKIVIIDWGQVLQLEDDAFYSNVVGTRHYMAPECLRPRVSYELKKSDMFAIGVIAFALLIGCFPFPIKNRNDIRRQSKSKINWNEVEISCDAKNFVESLLDENISTRLSVDEALNHAWIS
jgi:calcium-dependent protein kinase